MKFEEENNGRRRDLGEIMTLFEGFEKMLISSLLVKLSIVGVGG
jgi:hypothetical protein